MFLNEPSSLERYGKNVTLLAQQGAFSPCTGYETEVNEVFQVLRRRANTTNHYNPVIIDIDGNTRPLVVGEVVRRIAMGEAPDPFSSIQVIALDYEALCADVSSQKPKESLLLTETVLGGKEAWEIADEPGELKALLNTPLWPPMEDWGAPDTLHRRLQEIFLTLAQVEGVLLFVDPLHRLLGGEQDRYPIDAFELLKPALARRQIQLIGGSTLAQWQYLEQDRGIERRLQGIFLPDARSEIRRLRDQYRKSKRDNK